MAVVIGRTEKETYKRYKYLKSLAKNTGFTLNMRADLYKHKLKRKERFKDMTVTYEIGHEGKKLKHKRDKSDDVILVIEDDSDSRGESRFIFEREREHKHKHRSSHGHKSKHKSSPVVSDAESEYGSDNPPDIKSAPESALDPKWYNPAPRRAERSRVKFESRRTDRGVIDAVDMLEANFPGGKN